LLPSPFGNKIWQDANNNGLLDGSETGIANVAVELYTDANKDNVYTPGIDRLILSTTSNSSGEYQFVSKIAGNLLVVITNTNFITGGAVQQTAQQIVGVHRSGTATPTATGRPSARATASWAAAATWHPMW
jgi:hypothetical protein